MIGFRLTAILFDGKQWCGLQWEFARLEETDPPSTWKHPRLSSKTHSGRPFYSISLLIGPVIWLILRLDFRLFLRQVSYKSNQTLREPMVVNILTKSRLFPILNPFLLKKLFSKLCNGQPLNVFIQYKGCSVYAARKVCPYEIMNVWASSRIAYHV